MQPQIDLNVTNRCNFRCIQCGFASGSEATAMKDMDLDFAKQVLIDFKNIGGVKVDFTGGEPMLYAELPTLIAFASSLGLKTKLVTNGSLLTNQKLIELQELGLNGISVSIDGSNYKTFSKIRPVTETIYQRILQLIRNSVALNLFTKINTVIFNSNIDDIEKIVQQAIDLKTQEIRFCFFAPLGRGTDHFDEVADPVVWLDLVRNNLIKYKDQIRIVLEAPIIEKSFSCQTKCLARNLGFLQIFPNGDAYPCSIMATYWRPIVNLTQQSLADFWQNKSNAQAKYFVDEILPLVAKQAGCIDYPFHDLYHYKTGAYKFICPSRKFLVEEVTL